MYALKYPTNVIHDRARKIAEVLDGVSWLDIHEQGESLIVDISRVATDSLMKITLLLEEQSVLTDAIDYRMMFDKLGIFSISWIKDYILSTLASLNNENKVDLYNLVDIWIGGIIHEIQVAHAQNKVLNSQQQKDLEELISFQQRFLKLAGSRTHLLKY